jgi:hypothetical protein
MKQVMGELVLPLWLKLLGSIAALLMAASTIGMFAV